MVTEKFGDETWENICVRADIAERDFIAMEGYDDSVTYSLVGAASEELGLDAEGVLEAFGEYWVIYTAVEGYGELLNSAGDNLTDFLTNLDQMHARVKLAMPNLEPPRFRVTDQTDSTLVLHYFSDRPGLTPLVIGMVKGLAARFNHAIGIEHFRTGSGDDEHDAFTVSSSGAP
jgi:hypothetical protein